MDFRKRLIEELDLSTIAANTMYSVYIDVCEKIAKEYAKEQVEQVKNNIDLADVRLSLPDIDKEALKFFPLAPDNEAVDYQNLVMRSNFIKGANWMKDKI